MFGCKVQLSCVSEGVSHIIMCQYKVYYVSSDSGLIKTLGKGQCHKQGLDRMLVNFSI